MHVMVAGLLLWLVSTVCLFDHTSADFEKTCTTEDYFQQPRGLCGPKLSSILGIVCHNGYNKRSNEHSLASAYFPLTRDLMDSGPKMVVTADGAGDQQVPSELSHLARQNVFLPKASALAFLHDKRRVYMNDGSLSQGIVCECCVHQCTIRELQQYCAQPPK